MHNNNTKFEKSTLRITVFLPTGSMSVQFFTDVFDNNNKHSNKFWVQNNLSLLQPLLNEDVRERNVPSELLCGHLREEQLFIGIRTPMEVGNLIRTLLWVNKHFGSKLLC